MKDMLYDDLQKIAESKLPFAQYRNKVFLITGATGLVGSLLIKTLLYCNSVHNLNIKIIAVVRNKEKAEGIFEEFQSQGVVEYKIMDLAKDELKVDSYVNYIIHGAAVTTSKIMVSDPVGTIQTALLGTESVLKLASKKNVESMVYISSMEIYGQPQGNMGTKTREDELGYIDLTNVRSCYPEGKRMCECMCTAYAKQYNVNVKSARLAQTFGPGILPGENRVFAQFARSVLSGTDIILHTKGDSEGNYVYTRDAVLGILLLLTEGEAGQAYNIANEKCHLTIKQMAEMVAADIADNRIKVVVDLPEDAQKLGYAPGVKLWLNSEKIRQLGWKPEVEMKEAYERMINWMEQQKINCLE